MVHFLPIRSSLGPGRSPPLETLAEQPSVCWDSRPGRPPARTGTDVSGRDRGLRKGQGGTGASASSSSMCCYSPCLQQKGLQARAPPPPHPPNNTPITKMRRVAIKQRTWWQMDTVQAAVQELIKRVCKRVCKCVCFRVCVLVSSNSPLPNKLTSFVQLRLFHRDSTFQRRRPLPHQELAPFAASHTHSVYRLAWPEVHTHWFKEPFRARTNTLAQLHICATNTRPQDLTLSCGPSCPGL